ncbi:MAG: ABC transporter permease [Pseudomonadota bacterium]|nr:ABC transporter permease [Pseudomonadota bacterium]
MSIESSFPAAPAAALPIRPTLVNNLTVMWRVVYALMIRESRTRYGTSDLGYLWALFDPLIQLGVFWVIFTLLQRVIPVPASLPVFLVTGILPYNFWRSCVSRGATAATSNLQLLTYPQVTVFDVIIARVLLDIATLVVVTIIFVIGLRFTTGEQFSHWQRVPILQATAVITLFYFCFCSAVFSSSLTRIWPVWPLVFGYASRPLYFATGIFFTLQSLPTGFRGLAYYLPMAHMLEWIRTASIPGFVSTSYDPWYPITFGAVILFLGLVIDWLLRLVGHTDGAH